MPAEMITIAPPATGADAADEDVVFASTLAGPQLEADWQWVRQDASAWSFNACGGCDLALRRASFASDVAEGDKAAKPQLLLLPLAGATACQVMVQLPSVAAGVQDEAGLFWYIDDENHMKLVLVREPAGSVSATMAKVRGGEAVQHGRIALSQEEAERPLKLRLELSGNGARMTGFVDYGAFMKSVGRCPFGLFTLSSSVR
eukprot:TRINITY_DN44323_c0_g1_i1.p1 TRINITY_DN44323_c0_g1~~TRINITY_DN44323_c0_g1_i1.p1  ORF type:complete len:202 (+),score=54.59 TRINITY_DN44323_c0_g1_i1:73-678(+)